MSIFSAINRGFAGVISSLLDLLYFAPISRFIDSKTFRYFACGVMNYILFDAIIYYLIYHYFVGLNNDVNLSIIVISPHVASLMLTFPITFLSGFWLNRYVAFQATTSPARSQIIRYGISVAGSIIISYLSLKILVEVAHIWATPAKVLSSVVTAMYSYLMARFFTFKERKSVAGSEACKQK